MLQTLHERAFDMLRAAMHGMVSIELTHRDRTELPGRAVASGREGVYLDGVHALCDCLGLN
ncbi:hypothetical protein OH807_07160 [Kitasatospora sp. NBC_01560]|uniref:hypothetical protein n=1 Tax=Kitasatospora sp. NBC_01560 TaxID=2975965 RepID=UPI00386FE129